MKKYCLLFLFIAGALMRADAQFSFEGGLNMSNLRIKVNDAKIATKFIAGASLGMVGALPLSESRHVFLELGAFYQTNGAKITSKPEWQYTLSSLTFPINIEYKSGDRCSERFFAGAGPYIRANISGRAFTFDRSGMLQPEYKELVMGTDIKQIDLGLGLNAGYLGKKHWYVRVNGALGLKNNLVRGNQKTYVKQTTAGLTVGYLFRGCKVRYSMKSRSRSSNHWRGIKKSKWSTHQRLRRIPGPGAY